MTTSPIPASMDALLLSKGPAAAGGKIQREISLLSTTAYLTASLHSPEEAKDRKGRRKRRKSGDMKIRGAFQGGEVKQAPLLLQSNTSWGPR